MCDLSETARLLADAEARMRRGLALADAVMVPVEIAALVLHMIERRYSPDLGAVLISLGLAEQTAYDPERHGDGFDIEPGDSFLEWSPGLKRTLSIGQERLNAMYARGLN